MPLKYLDAACMRKEEGRRDMGTYGNYVQLGYTSLRSLWNITVIFTPLFAVRNTNFFDIIRAYN